eukprot:gene37428-46174_t
MWEDPVYVDPIDGRRSSATTIDNDLERNTLSRNPIHALVEDP